jgi:hypothetical protein
MSLPGRLCFSGNGFRGGGLEAIDNSRPGSGKLPARVIALAAHHGLVTDLLKDDERHQPC